jgi:hypothetical protein
LRQDDRVMGHLELMRDKAKDFPTLDDPASFTSARIWHCSYRSLAPVADLTGLTRLEIATYPDASLSALAGFVRLEELSILHLPNVTDLSPLQGLSRLRRLDLMTNPSWDSSGKVTTVDSLRPLTTLPLLEEVNLFGIVPADPVIDDLLECRALRRAKVSRYPPAEVERLRSAMADR